MDIPQHPMAHASFVGLEEKVEREGKKLPSLGAAVKNFFLDIFSHERYLKKEMEVHATHGRFEQAADYAAQLNLYEHAFTLYNQAIATGNWLANIPAAELAESLGDSEQGLQYIEQGLKYRLQANDFYHAGIDAARLGRLEESKKYIKKLHEPY